MSIIVKSMEMPRCCFVRRTDDSYPSDVYCCLTFEDIDNYNIVNEFCPLDDLPEKHGRLIDADELIFVLEQNFGHTDGAQVMKQIIENRPTVIEVEG